MKQRSKLKITKHGNLFCTDNSDELNDYIVVCPECANMFNVHREVSYSKSFFGVYSRNIQYNAKCIKCGCEFNCTENVKCNEVDIIDCVFSVSIITFFVSLFALIAIVIIESEVGVDYNILEIIMFSLFIISSILCAVHSIVLE